MSNNHGIPDSDWVDVSIDKDYNIRRKVDPTKVQPSFDYEYQYGDDHVAHRKHLWYKGLPNGYYADYVGEVAKTPRASPIPSKSDKWEDVWNDTHYLIQNIGGVHGRFRHAQNGIQNAIFNNGLPAGYGTDHEGSHWSIIAPPNRKNTLDKPKEVKVDKVEQILTERPNTTGKFPNVAKYVQGIKAVIHQGQRDRIERGQKQLTAQQMESMEMIAHKMGRILSGDADYQDHWDDMSGYAKIGNKDFGAE